MHKRRLKFAHMQIICIRGRLLSVVRLQDVGSDRIGMIMHAFMHERTVAGNQ